MLQNKFSYRFPPNQFIFRLTFANIIVTTAFVALSSWAIYQAACLLADGMLTMTSQNQQQFETLLSQYLWGFSLSAILLGGVLHYSLTKKITKPLRKLIGSAKKMKQGEYIPIEEPVKRDGEIGELINHFNELAQQMKTNEVQRKNFVSDLSHEFRTPLTNLNGYLRALQNGVLEGDERLYEALYKEASKLTELVEQMDKLKEWDDSAERTLGHKDTIEIKEFIIKSLEIFNWTMEQKNLELVMDIEACILSIDTTSISQVLTNLMDNAIRYHEGTGAIEIKGERQADFYKISVTGPGKAIPHEDKEKIFERFYRVEKSRSRELGGSGLGLAISTEIIEGHNGKIGLQSDKNRHTFSFELPHSPR